MHSVFALPFAIIGFFLAIQVTDFGFSWWKFLLMLFCMVTARNAAMAFNRYLDRRIDAMNERTVGRDIPSGRISAKQALVFTLVNCMLFVLATYFINSLCFLLSPVALFVILFYSYTKNFTPLCHLVLGVGLGLAPIGAYLVIAGQFAWAPVYFGLAVMCWSAGFDIIYALQDEKFDREHNLKSIPSMLGAKGALRVSEILHIASFFFILLPVWTIEVSIFYYIGVIFYGGLLVYQHTIVSPQDLSRVDRAFMTTNGIASVIFALFYIVDILYIRYF